MKKGLICAVCAIIWLAVAGCGPAKVDKFIDVGPDETFFIVNLQNINNSDNQFKFTSIEEIEKLTRVQAARIPIPQIKKDTGYMWWSFEYMAGIREDLRVSHTPVTREWTGNRNTGTSERDDRINVESLDSVGFSVGSVLRARVDPTNAATYLFFYRGKDLGVIVDSDIRGDAAAYLSGQFSSLPLDTNDGSPSCKNQKKRIADDTLNALKDTFSMKGITVESFGLVEGLEFEDKEIQASITRQIEAKQDLITAQAETEAQDERNTKEREIADKDAYVKEKLAEGLANAAIKKATGEAEAASILQRNKDALAFEVELYERRKRADAMVEAAKNLPKNILPSGTSLLMGLDK